MGRAGTDLSWREEEGSTDVIIALSHCDVGVDLSFFRRFKDESGSCHIDS